MLSLILQKFLEINSLFFSTLKILMKLFLCREESNPDSNTNNTLLKPVSELELSVRSANCLQNANIKYIYELVSKTEGEMLRTKNFVKTLNEIKELLTTMGLGLGMKVDTIMKEVQEAQADK